MLRLTVLEQIMQAPVVATPAICSRRTARPLRSQRPLLGALELLVA
jgi:hypothetical protein